MGMPIALHTKKAASISAAAVLIRGALASQPVSPTPREEHAQAKGAEGDRSDHEDEEARVDQVEPQIENERRLAGDKVDVFDRSRQANHKENEDAAGREDSEEALPAR